MADNRDTYIADTLRKWDEPYATSVWKVQGKPVIHHAALERIAAKAKIIWEMPQVVRAAENEAVLLVVGKMMAGDGQTVVRMEWSIGEARVQLMVADPTGKKNNWGKPEMVPAKEGDWGNYIVSGKQAGYPWAMAEKRAKDRVILKLIDLSGFVYSEEEADDFKQGHQDIPKAPAEKEKVQSTADKIVLNIKAKKTWEEVADFMQSDQVKERMAEMSEEDVQMVRWEGAEAMKSLGWVKGATPKTPPEKPPAGDASSRKEPPAGTGPIVDPDPYAKSNLATLANSIGSAVYNAKTVQDVEDAVEKVLTDRKIDWDQLPQESQEAVNRVADLRIAALNKGKK